jgi:hypothetical protein
MPGQIKGGDTDFVGSAGKRREKKGTSASAGE